MVALTLGQMIDVIRVEAGLKGDLDQENYFVIKINEILRGYTSLDRYNELLVDGALVTITTNGQTTFALPLDYQHFDAIFLNDVDFYFVTNLKTFKSRRRTNYARIVGVNLVLNYWTNLVTTDVLKLSYYAAPTLLTSLSSVFPIPHLCNLVCLKAAAEIKANTDGPKAKLLFDRAREEYNMVRASR